MVKKVTKKQPTKKKTSKSSANKDNFNIPKTAIKYMQSNREFDCSKLAEYENFKNVHFKDAKDWKIDSFDYLTMDLEEWLDIPEEKEGHYPIRYISLLSYREMLVWYPDLQCFGQIDRDHGLVLAFPDCSLEEICTEYDSYLMGMFSHHDAQSGGYLLDPRGEKALKFIEIKPQKTKQEVKYDEIKYFQIGMSIVKVVQMGNKWGVIEKKDNVIVPIEYDAILSVSPKTGLIRVKKDGKFGVYKKSKQILAPVFDEIETFDDHIKVCFDGKWSKLDINGKQKINKRP